MSLLGSISAGVWGGCLILCLVAAPCPAAPHSSTFVSSSSEGIKRQVGQTTVRVTPLSDSVLHVQIARNGTWPEDASWAVLSSARRERASFVPAGNGFTTRALKVTLSNEGRLKVQSNDDRTIVEDDVTPFIIDGHSFQLRKQLSDSEHYFGLGDKTGGLDRRGQSFVNWNTDAFGFTGSTDPIYKSIPFFVSVGGAGGSYGIFLDNSWRSSFDFGHKEDGVLSFGAPDGPIDYYIITGPTTAEVVRRFTDLTGKAPLPPEWSLGYQQSRYSYMSGTELRAIADRLRFEHIPSDVLWLDIDWQDRNRPFTVDQKAFPDLKGMVGDLGKEGFKLVAITDLHIAAAPNEGYSPYDSGVAGDRFIRRANGQVYVGQVWPGSSVFPDFTQVQTRAWYGGLFRGQVELGLAGAWNDMNEPAIFQTPTKTMPADVRHRISGDGFADRIASHAEIHNVYGMENTRATYEGLRALRPDERAFVMTRASYAGGQRYAVTWTGDNLATWDHLKLSVQQIINLGLSGFAWSGADVGGFAGGPSPELLTRWFEIGAFYPVFRNHSAKGTRHVEPWVDGPEHLAIRRRFIEERYRLMPYMYALADQNARHGDPILRPVFYDYPGAMQMPCDQSWSFTLGKALLIAPPPHPENPQAYDVCLPEGGWYDYWSGLPIQTADSKSANQPIQSATQAVEEKSADGGRLSETPRLDRLAVFVRAGTILPRQSLVQSTAQQPTGPLQLDVFPGGQCEGALYADDGHSMGFTRGRYLRQSISCQQTAAGVIIRFGERQGKYRPWWRQMAVVVHGLSQPASVTINGRSVAASSDAARQSVAFVLPDIRQVTSVVVAVL